MTSIKALKRDIEMVRRALTPDSEHEYYRKQAETANRLFSDLERTLEYEAARLTEQDVTALNDRLNESASSSESGYDSGVERAHIRDVLSLYQRTRNTLEVE